LADYFTKHHPPSHHVKMRPVYLYTGSQAQAHTPDCRGVLIPSPGSGSSHACGGWRASTLARRAGCSGSLNCHYMQPRH
jgi:hypothetical protein